MPARAALVLRLAWRDMATERLPAYCTAASLAATFAPLLVLAGLQSGIMKGLHHSLLDDPHAREIATVANGSFAGPLLDQLTRRPDVAFLVPHTRTLAASMLINAPAEPATPHRIEIQPTAPGDPLLGPAISLSNRQLVLSSSAAFSLRVGPGAIVDARVARLADGRLETVHLSFSVAAVAAPAVNTHDVAYITLALAEAVEDYQEGDAAWPDLDASAPSPRAYAGFRLYAKRLDQVPALDGALRGMGIEIVSRAGDVAGLLTLDRHLSILFTLVASLGATGFLVSLGTGLWANVERKRHAFALLRLAGLGAFALLLFPIAQSALLALGGSLAGILAAEVVAHVINAVFVGTLPGGQPLCTVTASLAALAVAVTVCGAALAAFFAGYRASRIQAWEGVTNT